MTAIQPDDYFASVEARFESPSPYGRKEITVEAPKHVCECGKAFDTEQGLRVHKGRAHGKPQTEPKSDHCDHVAECCITGITDCGADPCELVAAWREERCDTRTDAECSNQPCHDCEIDAYKPRKLKTIHVPVVADVRVRMNEPDYRMELIETLAELATWEATLDDSGPVQATLARIKAVVRS